MKLIIQRASYLLILLIFICLLFVTACEKEIETGSEKPETVGNVLDVFELKYGEKKEFSYNDDKFIFSIYDIEDRVDIDCSLVDYMNNQEDPLNIRLYVDLKVNNIRNNLLRVASKPCGAEGYYNNGGEVKAVEGQILALKTAPASLNDSTGIWYSSTFINYFGEGALIRNTPYRIFIAKASPTKFNQPDAAIDDYKFVFIITTVE